MNRNQIQVKSVEGDLWDQTEVTARFKILGIRNASGSRCGRRAGDLESDSDQLHDQQINTVPSTTLLNPNAQQPFAGTGYITSIVHTKSESVGLYFVDTVKLGRLFDLSGGVRWDRFDTGYNLYQPYAACGWDGDGGCCADQQSG